MLGLGKQPLCIAPNRFSSVSSALPPIAADSSQRGSFEAVRRSERPERETIFSLSIGEGVEKSRRWNAIERAAERAVECGIDAIAADCEASRLKRGEQVIAGKTAGRIQTVAGKKVDQFALGGLERL